jgi:hypothetical protein
MRLVGHEDFGGAGACMHVNVKDGYAYVAHQGGGGVSVVDVRDPRDPREVTRLPAPPNSRGHEVQVVDDVLLVNRERRSDAQGGVWDEPWAAGLSVFDVADAANPVQIAYWACGGRGVHRMAYWEHPYAYATIGSTNFSFDEQFLAILDLSDPRSPQEVGRWWYPGMMRGEEDQRTWDESRTYKLHHGIPRGDRLYCGWWDLGLVILDVSDPARPTKVSELVLDEVDGPSRRTHTVCPLPDRDLLVTTDEEPATPGDAYHVRLVDIGDERRPQVLSRLPVPEGDFALRFGRFGPHNIHEPRPGSYRNGDRVYLTYFNAGVRVYDVSDAAAPEEIAWFVPKAPRGRGAIQLNDLFVAPDGLVYVTDRNTGGLYILEMLVE